MKEIDYIDKTGAKWERNPFTHEGLAGYTAGHSELVDETENQDNSNQEDDHPNITRGEE